MGKAHRITITADVLKALPSRMFGEVGEVAVVGVLERGFPGRLAVFVDGNGPESGGCNVLDQVQANRWTVCDAKSLWLKSLPPLRFESVQTAFVPKTHSDTGLFLLLKAAELSREWQREIVVVQLDVKKAFDHVDHRAAFKAMKLQGVSLFSMALIAAIWNGSCMKACLGTVTSNKVQMSRGLPQGAPESPVIFTMIMELVLRDLIKSWITLKLAWRLYDFALAAICYADDVVLVTVSMSASEIMVTEALAKTERGWTDGWRTENTLDEFPEDDGQKHHGGWIGCGVGGSIGVCGIDGVLRQECKTCDRTENSSSQQMYGEVETSSEFFMAPKVVAVEHCKDYNVAGILLEFECLDNGQGPKRQKLRAGVRGWWRTSWMELDQWWRLWHRTGHRWIEKGKKNVWTAIRERVLSWAGHVARMDHKDICSKALRCRGRQWWRWRQLHWQEKEVEKDKCLAHTHNGSKSTGGRTWFLGKCPNSLEMQTVCRYLSRTTRVCCILLKTVKAGNSFRYVERALKRWSWVLRGPMRRA